MFGTRNSYTMRLVSTFEVGPKIYECAETGVSESVWRTPARDIQVIYLSSSPDVCTQDLHSLLVRGGKASLPPLILGACFLYSWRRGPTESAS